MTSPAKRGSQKRDDRALDNYPDTLINEVVELLGEDEATSAKVISAAISGGETKNDDASIENWIHIQLKPNLIFIDKSGYTEQALDALKTLSTQVLTDFGTSRQRDFGQAWADKTRGYLGEQAVVQFLSDKFKVETRLAHQQGNPEDFYDSDIAEVKDGGNFRPPRVFVGIKTTKFNGIWLDIAKEQFLKSNYHVQVKIGGGTSHLFSFFKEIGVFEDHILKVGLEQKFLTQQEADQIYRDIPDFKPIPGYITGFAIRSEEDGGFIYGGNKARLHYTINTFKGLLPRDYEEIIKKREKMSGGSVKFQSIEKFSSSDRYLFNTGNLVRTYSDWKNVVSQL
jgi:hypothetical protein